MGGSCLDKGTYLMQIDIERSDIIELRTSLIDYCMMTKQGGSVSVYILASNKHFREPISWGGNEIDPGYSDANQNRLAD